VHTDNNIVQIPIPWYGSVCPALTEKAAYIAALLVLVLGSGLKPGTGF